MLLKFFDELKTNDNAGGKGKSLAKLSKSKFNVPNGFIILSDAFDEFIKENDILDKINKTLENLNEEDGENLKNSSKYICDLIEKAKINSNLEHDIIDFFRKLNTQFVAVRSSATTEDGMENAWAGELDTFLYVDESTIMQNIKNAWKSLYSTRALYYGKKNNQIKYNSIAVVVQKMINSDYSGVAFSINPINNNKGTIVIEAIEGLGEAIVSGTVTPDCYEINKSNLSIKSKIINNQREKISKNENSVDLIKNENSIQKISNEKIIELAEIVKNIEIIYEYPIDVEWAIEDDIIYILQARPITTKNNLNEETINLLNKIIDKKNWEFLWLREFSWFVENTEIYAGTKKYQNKFLGFDLCTQNRLCINGDEYILSADSKYENEKLDIYSKNTNFWKNFVKKDFEIEEDTKKYIEYMNSKDFASLDDNLLLKEFELFDEAYIKSFVQALIIPEEYIYNKVNQLLQSKGFDEKTILKIISDVAKCPNHNKIYYNDEPLDLLKIALKKKNKCNIDYDLKKHIEEYGWLKAPCAVEDVSFSREEYIERINTILNFDLENRINEIYKVREENDNSLNIAALEYNLDQELIDMISILRDFTFLHTYIAQNTDHLFYTARHTLFKEITKRVKIKDSDIVSLSDIEIIQLLKDKNKKDEILSKIEERKKGFAILWIDENVYKIYGEDANYIANEISNRYKTIKDNDSNINETNDNSIKGNIANLGKVTGTAKLLFDYEDIKKVNIGDIIVTSMTAPVFVSAMEKAAAFVTDEGGITCHAAIISREFGVPCIVGTICATKKIQDGDYIEVDAYKGKIRIIKKD